MGEKVQLADRHGKEYGVNRVLAALELSKGTWGYERKRRGYGNRHQELQDPMIQVVREHPEYGYRRIHAELKGQDIRVNRKVVQRCAREWYLTALRRIRSPQPGRVRQVIQEYAGSCNLVKGMVDPEVLQVLFTDFSELVYARGGKKAQLMPMVDAKSRVVVGWSLGETATTETALRAWEMGKRFLKRVGRSSKGIIVHHDQDPVYTSTSWVRAVMIQDRARISYSENGARGNTAMESFFGRFKGENHSLFYDIPDLETLRKVVRKRIRYYNTNRRHSSLEYATPMEYLAKHIGKTDREN